MRKVLLLLGMVCAACSSPSTDSDAGTGDAAVIDAGPDADFGQPSTTYPVFMPRVPQVVAAGGPVMASVRVVPVFYSGDANQTKLVDFLNKLPPSTYWSSAAEYGVGALSVDAPIVLATAAPATITPAGIGAMVASSLDGSHVEWGATDAATLAKSVYVVYLPSTTSVTYDGGAKSCTAILGYHDSAVATSGNAIFAIVSECDPEPPLTWGGASSHEIVEAATDPYPATPAFQNVDSADFTWQLIARGGEVGDLCGWFKGGGTVVPDIGAKVQRIWSNAAMAAFHDPCLPSATGVPFFAAVPRFDDDIPVDLGHGTFNLKGIVLKVGVPRTVDVDLLSDGPTGGPWTVTAVDAWQNIGTTPSLTLSLDNASGVNGNKIHLTLTATTYPAALGGAAVVDLVSTLGATTRHWVGGVAVQP